MPQILIITTPRDSSSPDHITTSSTTKGWNINVSQRTGSSQGSSTTTATSGFNSDDFYPANVYAIARAQTSNKIWQRPNERRGLKAFQMSVPMRPHHSRISWRSLEYHELSGVPFFCPSTSSWRSVRSLLSGLRVLAHWLRISKSKGTPSRTVCRLLPYLFFLGLAPSHLARSWSHDNVKTYDIMQVPQKKFKKKQI